VGPVPPVRRPDIVRIFAVASRALRDAVRLPSAAVDPTTATLGLAAIGPAGKLGGQRPPGLFSVALVVAQAMIKSADELCSRPGAAPSPGRHRARVDADTAPERPGRR
jgi:hypothetical protein